MASISKRVSGAWQNTSYGIRATATDTIATLPTTIYGDGTKATIGVYGNTIQSGTPTPDNPIMPEGCGELEAGQYKIPISSANTTTPIYLGEVETTRAIRKYVFNGTEEWQRTSNGAYYLGSRNCPQNYKKTLTESIVMCTHYVGQVSVTGSAAVQDNNISFYGGPSATYELYIGARSISTLAEFTTYLEQQYAAGTPVTIWYVLANEETAVVNEPLMCIGDYADEVLGVSIPTTDGANTLSVDTTVQPSEVIVNYHGWHMGAVHERNSGQWD